MRKVPEMKTAIKRLTRPKSVRHVDDSVPAVLPHVVIVGAGFGGLRAAHALADTPVKVTVIDQKNHRLFRRVFF